VQKRVLRRWLRALPKPAGAAADACGRAAAVHLATSPELARARRVALFASLPDELSTRPIFALLRRIGRIPLLPRIRPGEALEFAALWRWEDLRLGAFGVGEAPAGSPPAPLGAGDLVLVPGLGFDRRGGRLGRGGGYYDRTFPPGMAAPTLLGLGFHCQLLDEIPSGAQDRRIDGILTEHGRIRVSSIGGQGDGG
jgi:5-formyltetrahydrofolate cyclo-ligase